jgi:proteasome lid subunit RPN8/RPN11
MTALAKWSTPECPFVIEYAPGPLESIRIAVSDAFFSVPRGGAEIGGILLGKWEPGRLTISSYKPLDCEHAFGPSFTLSPRDRAQLTELIASVKTSGEQIAGWYHSHTRSLIFLSEADCGIYNEFFPEPWQVALVLRPDTFLPTRAGFFFRDAAGSMRTESSCLEFTVEPLEPKPAPSAAPGLAGASPASEVVVDAPSHSLDPDPSPSQPPSHSTEAAAAERLPRFLDAKPPTPRRFPKILIPLAVGAAVCAAAYWKRDLWIPRVMPPARAALQPTTLQSAAPPPVAPALNTVDFDGQLQIRWNRNSHAVAQATDGVLRVKGGAPSAEEIVLDRDHLLSGVFTIARQSERVDVSLQLNQPAGQAVREVTSFIGKLPEAKSATQEKPAAQPATDGLAKEVTKIKADLDAEIQRNRKIQKSVDFLAKQLHDQQRARLLNQAPDNKK